MLLLDGEKKKKNLPLGLGARLCLFKQSLSHSLLSLSFDGLNIKKQYRMQKTQAASSNDKQRFGEVPMFG